MAKCLSLPRMKKVGIIAELWAKRNATHGKPTIYGQCCKAQLSTQSSMHPSASITRGNKLLLNRQNFYIIQRTYKSQQNQEKGSAFSSNRYTIPFGGIICILAGCYYKKEQRIECETGSCVSKSAKLSTPPKTLSTAIQEGQQILQRVQNEIGCPGLVISVSVDGKNVWSQGIGFADIENQTPCHKDTVMRIASISKSIAMTLVARQMELGKLDLDKPIQTYVPDWPEKYFNNERVTITTRQLVSHLGGIRHYDKECGKKKENNKNTVKKKEAEKQNTSEFDLKEYHIKDHFESVGAAVKLFQDDSLCSKPGTEYLYSTHCWTLISAVFEGASGMKFTAALKRLFNDLGLENTYLDENDPLIYNRARFYTKNKHHKIINVPFVDCSYKWAGGGLLSTAPDLVKFGNAMLYSYQYAAPSKLTKVEAEIKNKAVQDKTATGPKVPGYLKPETVTAMWTGVPKTKVSWDSNGKYGMGWAVIPQKTVCGQGREQRFYVGHTGGAIGGSSVLLIMPRREEQMDAGKELPQGVVVSIITNLQAVGLNKTALKIAQLFDEIDR